MRKYTSIVVEKELAATAVVRDSPVPVSLGFNPEEIIGSAKVYLSDGVIKADITIDDDKDFSLYVPAVAATTLVGETTEHVIDGIGLGSLNKDSSIFSLDAQMKEPEYINGNFKYKALDTEAFKKVSTMNYIDHIDKIWEVVVKVLAGWVYYQVLTETVGGIKHMRIIRRDRKAIPNWMHFQQIKNDLWGEDTVAIEVFPKGADLKNGSNTYHLWTWPQISVPNLNTYYNPMGGYDKKAVPKGNGVVKTTTTPLILDYLAQNEKVVTVRQITKDLGLRYANVAATLSRLAGSGKLRVTKRFGTQHAAVSYYGLADWYTKDPAYISHYIAKEKYWPSVYIK